MAGALPLGFDPLSNDDANQSPLAQVMSTAGRNAGDENLAWWGGFLQPNPNGTSGALSNALKAQSTSRLEKDKLISQYIPLIQQAMVQNFMSNALGDIYGGQGAGQGAPQDMPQSPANGIGGAPQGGMPQASPSMPQGAPMPGAQGVQGGAAGSPVGGQAHAPTGNSLYDRVMGGSYGQALQADAMTGGHFGFANAWKLAHEGIKQEAGAYYTDPTTGQQRYNIKYPDGIGPQGAAPNVAGGIAVIEGAKTGAQKLAENQNTPLDPTKFLDPNGNPIGGTVAQYLGQQGVPTGTAQPGSQKAADNDRAIALSSGLDQAYMRYLQAQAGSDQRTKDLTKQDVLGFATEMKRQGIAYIPPGQRVPLGNVTPQDVANAGGGDVGGGAGGAAGGSGGSASTGTPKLQGPAAAAGQKTTAEEAAKSGQNYQNALNDKVEEEFQLVQRNKQILPLLDRYNTGGIAPEERLQIGNAIANSGMLQTLFGTNQAKAWGDKLAGGDVTAGKTLENQLASAGILTMLQTLDKEGKPNRAIFQAVQSAQEGLKSGNTTLRDVFELQNRLYGIHYNEQQAMTQAIKDGTYNPRTWAGDYAKIRNAELGKPAAPLPSAMPPQFKGFSAVLKGQ